MELSSDKDWTQWAAEYAPRLLLFARQHVAESADAEDLVQEAMIESWRRQGDDTPPPIAWVYTTIRRRAIDQARAITRRKAREEETGRMNEQWFAPEVGADEDKARIQEALMKLNAEQREVLVMKIWGGLSFRDIADVMDIPLNTAASRYRYALEAMRNTISE